MHRLHPRAYTDSRKDFCYRRGIEEMSRSGMNARKKAI